MRCGGEWFRPNNSSWPGALCPPGSRASRSSPPTAGRWKSWAWSRPRAKYGARANHFYWVGAIPAMLFLALFMMPIYHRSRVRSVPEFLKLRYGEKTRAFNAAGVRHPDGAGLGHQPLRDGDHSGQRARLELHHERPRRGRRRARLRPPGRTARDDLQRGAAVRAHRRRADAARRPGPAGISRLVGTRGGAPGKPAPHLEGHAGGEPVQFGDGRRGKRDRPGVRAELRLLVHRLPADPARARREEPAGRGPDTAYRLRRQALLPRPGRVLPGLAAVALFPRELARATTWPCRS